ncbi:odorant-binding protein 2a-like isoform X1 [Arvicanthis niloticus]|uniref:odorant-binding protein 2a-like isoform X1 n=1 Tax=Arvicanthis niloticus TaxID=61156 RepID=UPI00402B4103
MKSLLLTVLLLGLVAVLKAQEGPSDDQEDFSGIWYTKATVCDRNLTGGNIPKRTFPMTVTALEGGDLQVWITYWVPGACEVIFVHLERTSEPRKYTALNGKSTVYIQKIPVKGHYVFFCVGRRHRKPYCKAKLVGRDPEENPEAMEEFKKFVKSKGFREEYIIVPEQRDQCVLDDE